MRIAFVAAMISVEPKTLLRDALVGFGIGLVVMLGLTYGATTIAASPPAATTSAQ